MKEMINEVLPLTVADTSRLKDIKEKLKETSSKIAFRKNANYNKLRKLDEVLNLTKIEMGSIKSIIDCTTNIGNKWYSDNIFKCTVGSNYISNKNDSDITYTLEVIFECTNNIDICIKLFTYNKSESPTKVLKFNKDELMHKFPLSVDISSIMYEFIPTIYRVPIKYGEFLNQKLNDYYNSL